MGNDELVPKFASASEPASVRRAAVPMHIGFVKFGGISVSLELPDSG